MAEVLKIRPEVKAGCSLWLHPIGFNEVFPRPFAPATLQEDIDHVVDFGVSGLDKFPSLFNNVFVFSRGHLNF